MIVGSSVQNRFYLYALALWVFIALNPFYIWGYTPECQALIAGICLFLFFFNMKLHLQTFCTGLFFSGLVFFFYYFYGASPLGCLYFFASYFVFYCLSPDVVLSVFKLSKRLIAVLLIPGLFVWAVHHLTGDNRIFSLGPLPDYKMPDQLKLQAGVGYVVYPMTVVLDYMLDNPFYRFFGFFDEPGALGTFSALLLAADKFNLKSRSNLVIFVSGVLSLSMAFFILSFSCFVLEIVRERKKGLVLLGVMGLLIALSAQNEYLKTQVYDRFSYSSDGLAADNRNTEGFNKLFSEWESSGTESILFGSKENDGSGSASFKKIIFNSGLVGTFFFISSLLAFALRHKVLSSFDGFFFSLLLTLSILQRPLVIAPAFLLVIAAAGHIKQKGRKVLP
ncbi:hypothetical protein AB3464_14255 [Pseudomonas asplenii]|uniref:O-Antigen ligase n=1 Tax=Pseudomonas asplenii TaxID=53407 RepID=A0A1H6MJV2_9PSED|nr:hypothetical protein [Pseudomonas fuscovaginae]SEH97853.1 hypothetical protein SAMN05216581_0958 [Pseudomonas fuscovaginae]